MSTQDLPEVTEEMLADLAAKAEAATPGPWCSDRSLEGIAADDPGDLVLMQAYGVNGHIAYGTGFSDAQDEDATFAFIAAANPAVVAALVRELRVLGKALEIAMKRDDEDCYGCQLSSVDKDGDCPADETGDMPPPSTCQQTLTAKFIRLARAAIAEEEADRGD